MDERVLRIKKRREKKKGRVILTPPKGELGVFGIIIRTRYRLFAINYFPLWKTALISGQT